MKNLILGIDTSNYKTSLAVTDADRRVIYERSEFLKVEQGKRGLRQSVAFFQHCQVVPSFVADAFEHVDPKNIAAVAVSDRPRRRAGSYMPVFLSGIHAGEIVSSSLQIPIYRFSHQEGHIESALWSLPDPADRPFLFFHLSGGTTEALLCRKTPEGYSAEIVGGTKDISIGQLLDRTGVYLGYPFPAGKYLDAIAEKEPVTIRPGKVRVRSGYFNLSGTETQIQQIIDSSGPDVVPGVLECIANLLHETAVQLSTIYDVRNVIFSGGVAASRTIRKYAESWPAGGNGCPVSFAEPELSGDNAVGISLLGGRTYYKDLL